ncbi:MAG TPA: hypothetical protein VKV36_03415 [Acidimicrobiales bacterium]|nr:hypothetical protein [Acidimicrobiales bacterium]
MRAAAAVPGARTGAEPFWIELDAEVEIVPVMNLEDLMKGLSLFGASSSG